MLPTQFRILYAALGLCLLCVTITGSRLKVRDVFDHTLPQPRLKSPGSLSIRTWQWNAGKKNLTYEVEELFEKRDDNADLIAVCMTEAAPETEVHTIVEERGLSDKWALVGYGKHTGFAGGIFNSQILSVFLRQPTEKPYTVNADPVVAQKGAGWGVAGWQKDYLSEKTQIPGVLSSKTMIHQTSGSGKGGVSTVLSFDRVSNFEKTSVALICAHLDSEDSDDRRKGLTVILDEATRGSTSSSEDAHLAFDGLPCTMFDATHDKCSGSQAAPRQLDSVLLMGDLNFRLRWLKDDGSTAPFPKSLDEPNTLTELRLDDLFTAAGRKAMSVDDPLNPLGSSPEILVKDAPDGFAFLCDEPYDWLPSYKRNRAEACVTLAKLLRGCQQLGPLGPRHDDVSTGNCTDAQVADLAAACFKDKKSQSWKLKTEKKQPIKKRLLQLGWLDRVCFRSIGDEPMSFKISDAYHWDDHIYEKDELSDHSPVEMLLTITNKHGMCPLQVEEADNLLSPGSSVPKVTRADSASTTPAFRWLEASKSHVSQSEQGVHAECPDGFHFGVTPVDDQNPFAETRPDKQQLKCQGGSLKTLDEIDTKDLMCKRYCGPPKTLDNGKRLDEAASTHPRAAPFVTGAKSRFACDSFYVLSGTALQTCGPDGTYGEDAENLRCLRTCASVSELQNDLQEHGTVSLQRSPFNVISEENKVAEGDRVTLRCNDGLTLSDGLPESTLTCTDSGKYDRPIPKCLAACGDPPDVDSTSKLAVRVASSLTGNPFETQPWKAGMKVLDGNVIEFSCSQGKLQGVDKLRCESDGMYHPLEAPERKLAIPEVPVCLVECTAPPIPSNAEVVSSGDSSNGALLPGAELHYSCKDGCAMLGDSKIKCENEGVFSKEPPQCLCEATLHLNSVHFEGIDMKEVNTMKLKLYPRDLDGKAGSGQKGYDKKSYQKLSPEDFHDLDFRLDHDLNSFFFHVELCESSVTNWLKLHSSRCETIAISDEPRQDDAACPSCFGAVVQQVFGASSDSKIHELVLPVSGKGVSQTGSVKLLFSFPGTS